MRTLAALDLYFIRKELASFDGAHLDKVYQPSKEELLLQIHKDGKQLIRILVGSGVFLSSRKAIDAQLTFAMFLRKHLGNARVYSVQKNFERILEFHFKGKDEKILIVELFSKGNIILCDDQYKIIGVFEKQNWKDRKVEIGGSYTYPPAGHLDMASASFGEFEKKLEGSSRENIVKSLAIEFGLGGVYAEEVCARANIDKNAKKLSPAEKKKVFSTIKDILALPLSPIKTSDGAAFPFELITKPGISIPSFSQALEDEFITGKDPLEKDRAKLLNAIALQEERKKELEQEIELEKRKAEVLYENYDVVVEILKSPLNKINNFPQVKKIDMTKKSVVIEL